MKLLTLIAIVCGLILPCFAAAKRPVAPTVKPTYSDVPYGTHPRQVIDFWQAESDKPRPLVFFIHGGGWNSGDKNLVFRSLNVEKLLAAGISVSSINYRLIRDGEAAGLKSPVEFPLTDAKRALQFVRSKAAEWNVDKRRIGACGSSAGACSSLWLALHDDMAEPGSDDKIARESSRLDCAAVIGAQTSLDPAQVRAWIPNAVYGGHAFGFRQTGQSRTNEFDKFLATRDKVLPEIRKYSPIEHVSAGDPPLCLFYVQTNLAVKGEPQKDPTHSALYGLLLEEKTKPAGVSLTVTYPAKRQGEHTTATDYFLARFKR